MALIGILAGPASAQQTATSPSGGKGSVVGTWRLLSIETRNGNGDLIEDANLERGRGAKPAGIITYTSTGAMAVQINPTDRKKFEGSEPSGDEAKALIKGFTAYYGTYSIRETDGAVIHHIESHLNPNLIGTEYTRFFELAGDRLILRLPTVTRGTETRITRLFWQRVGVAGTP